MAGSERQAHAAGHADAPDRCVLRARSGNCAASGLRHRSRQPHRRAAAPGGRPDAHVGWRGQCGFGARGDCRVGEGGVLPHAVEAEAGRRLAALPLGGEPVCRRTDPDERARRVAAAAVQDLGRFPGRSGEAGARTRRRAQRPAPMALRLRASCRRGASALRAAAVV